MGYVAVWKVLERMIVNLGKKRVIVPTQVTNDLKSAKTMIEILKVDPSHEEILQKIDEHMRSVESYIVSEGARRFGSRYVEEFLRRVDTAAKEIHEEEKEKRNTQLLPRKQTWVRVLPSDALPLEKLTVLAQESKLLFDIQSNGYLLVYGDQQTVKTFVKKIATKCRLEPEKKR